MNKLDIENVTNVTRVHDEIHQVSETNISPLALKICRTYSQRQTCKVSTRLWSDNQWNGSEFMPLRTNRRNLIVRNPRNHKRYSIEFVVVRENLVPIIYKGCFPPRDRLVACLVLPMLSHLKSFITMATVNWSKRLAITSLLKWSIETSR